MSKNERYIIMQPPYTLDKWKDGAAQVRSEKEFQELVNYIPYDGSIVTREGILTLTYTPQTTNIDSYFTETGGITITSNDTAEFCRCRLVLKFDTDNYIGHNSVFGASPAIIASGMGLPTYGNSVVNTWTTSDLPKEGSGSLFISTAELSTAVTADQRMFGVKINMNAADWLPGQTTLTTFNRQGMFTYWVRHSAYAQYENDHINAHICGTETDRAHFTGYYNAFGNKSSVRSFWGNSNGGTIRAHTITNDATNRVNITDWNFIASWCSISANISGLYIYNDVTKEEYYSSTSTVIVAQSTVFTRCEKGHVTVGGYAAYYALGGGYRLFNYPKSARIDYVTYWDIIPSVETSVITLIRLIRDLHKA